MYEMIEKRPDWCVSRQRFWGVPDHRVLSAMRCGTRLEDFTALRNVVKWFEKEGADAWYKHSAEELLPAGNEMPLRRRRNGVRKTTFWMCGSIPALRTWRC